MDYNSMLSAFDKNARVSSGVGIFTLALLVLHNKYPALLQKFGAFSLVDSIKGPVFLICLGAWVIFSISVLNWIYNICKTIFAGVVEPHLENRKEIKIQKNLLSTLSPDEKKFLRRYIEEDIATINAPPFDGLVGGLNKKTIIFQATNISAPAHMGHHTLPYNIQPWAKVMLNKYPKYLK